MAEIIGVCLGASSEFFRCGVGLKKVHFDKFPGDAEADGQFSQETSPFLVFHV